MTDTPDEVAAELLAREPLFHRRELGTGRAAFESMTAPDYWEVGASGTVYDRESVWHTLSRRYADEPVDRAVTERWSVTEARVRPLGAQTYALTYTLHQPGRTTRRITLWQRHGTRWRALYHQGTPAD